MRRINGVPRRPQSAKNSDGAKGPQAKARTWGLVSGHFVDELFSEYTEFGLEN